MKIDIQGRLISQNSSWLANNNGRSCACDIPSHNYTWSFEPKLDWSGVYASGKEIFAYFDSFAEKYHLKDYIKTQHQVVGAYWNNDSERYDVKIRDLKRGQDFSQYCDILINASGFVNNWKWPAIPGLDSYKGTLLHTANWDDSVDLTGKHVGLIGNGLVNMRLSKSKLLSLHLVDRLAYKFSRRSKLSQAKSQHSFARQLGYRRFGDLNSISIPMKKKANLHKSPAF